MTRRKIMIITTYMKFSLIYFHGMNLGLMIL